MKRAMFQRALFWQLLAVVSTPLILLLVMLGVLEPREAIVPLGLIFVGGTMSTLLVLIALREGRDSGGV